MTLAPGDLLEVVIERLGGRGDGVARVDGVPVFVPLTLPGDHLRVRIVGRRGDGFAGAPVERRVEAARVPPPCPHFGACGGCQLQHVPPEQYALWKRQQVATAFGRQGLGAVRVGPLQIGAPGARRRARFGFVRQGRTVRLGFREAMAHRLVDLAVCPVLLPPLAALLAPLRALLASLDPARRRGQVQVTASATGIDLLLLAPPAPSLAEREALAAFAGHHDLARVSWSAGTEVEAEPVAERRAPSVAFRGVRVELPPGAFLQATTAAEAAIDRAVEAALGDAGRIADLFAGCGTLGLPRAAAGRAVHAVESNRAMLDALARAARGLRGRVTIEPRDLARSPLAGAELDRFDGVIVDPPRAGARAQAEALAGSGVARLALVSCNPATAARDARVLTEGGYQCLWIQPIDAFLWSSRIELVAAFAKIDSPSSSRGPTPRG